MFYLSFVDVFHPYVSGGFTGYIAILGLVFCSQPTLIYGVSMFGHGTMFTEEDVAVFSKVSRIDFHGSIKLFHGLAFTDRPVILGQDNKNNQPFDPERTEPRGPSRLPMVSVEGCPRVQKSIPPVRRVRAAWEPWRPVSRGRPPSRLFMLKADSDFGGFIDVLAILGLF